jgi:hypothetical protein
MRTTTTRQSSRIPLFAPSLQVFRYLNNHYDHTSLYKGRSYFVAWCRIGRAWTTMDADEARTQAYYNETPPPLP